MFNLTHILIACALCLTCSVFAQEDPQTEYPESVADCASMRVPCATIRGVTNQRFQWSSMSDIPLYAWQHHIKPFIEKHQDQILKYLPKVIQTAIKINQEKNVILAAIPVWLKVLKKH